MRNLGIFGLFSVLAMTGCAANSADGSDPGTSEDMLVSSSPRTFDLAAVMPTAKKTFATPTGKTEVCVIAKHFTEDGYGPKDKKKEEKLCKVDWYAAVGADGATP